ncbi:MAG TPA: PEP-CTERM sorting domain-containing protein [Rubrivivax sp.]|jgi:hypothetical protein|nr:PEP-CTERM sorting domain-containing protein [Rubrivivax sp.]
MSASAMARTAMAVALAVGAVAAPAAVDTTKGTWFGTDGTDGTLRGRDASGNPVSLLVSGTPNPALKYVYDTALDLTWLADWNAGAGSSFDNGSSSTDGRMTWSSATAWAAALTDFGGGWSLPGVTDIGNDGCNYGSNGTDCGFNVDTSGSPLAHMYYVTLGNLAYHDTSGSGPQDGWGLKNAGPFSDMLSTESVAYWSGTPHTQAPSAYAWYFYTLNGYQHFSQQSSYYYAVAVRPGDVFAVPEPASVVMLLAGLGAVGAAVRRRRKR